jgi:hypothetical protein
MEDKFTNQERQLRALADNFSLDIDTSELWGKLESQLPPVEQKRRRPLIWWFFGGALMLLIGALIWRNQLKTESIEIITQNLNNPVIQNGQEESIDTKIKHTNTTTFAKTQSETASFQESADSDNSAITSDLNQLVDTEPKQAIEKIQKKNVSTNANSERYDEKSLITEEAIINQGQMVQKSIDALVDASFNMVEVPEVEVQNESKALVAFDPLGLIALDNVIYSTPYSFPLLEIKPVSVNYWIPYFALTSGMNIHNSKIYSIENEAFDLSQFENEKPLVGLSSELRMGMEHSSGWRWGIGLNHTRLVNRFSQMGSDTIVSEVLGNAISKIDNNGNITNIDGPLLKTSITDYDLIWHRNHDFISIQINAGKRIYRKGKITVFADGSIGKNIWSKHSGYYFTEIDENIKKFESGEDNPYSKASYDIGISMDLEYQLKYFSLSFRPFAKMGLNSITQKTNYYQLKNSQYGVQLGIVYRP